MFELRDYIKKGFLGAIGRQSEYWIRLNSAGWLKDGVLLEEDLSEIETAIEMYQLKKNEEMTADTSEDIIEEGVEENSESTSKDSELEDEGEEIVE